MNAGSSDRESEQILLTLGSVLRRRRTVLAVCLLGVLAAVLYYNETTPPLYEASASVVFEELQGPLPDVSTNLSRELYLFDRIEEINSRAFADDVAAALPPEALPRIPMPEKRSPDFDRMRQVSELIHEGISAYPLRNSNIVRIRVRLSDPRLCMDVARLCLSVLEERTGQTRSKGVADLRGFIEDQLGRSAARLEESERDLRSFKERSGITSLEGDTKEILRKMTDAEVLYNTTLADRGAAQKRLEAVRQAIAAQRNELVPMVTSIASPAVQKLREKLVGLEAQHAQLILQKYPDSHPELVRLRQEIEQTKETLADEAMKLAKTSEVGDPLARIERRLEESVTLQIDVEGLEARADALKRTVESYRRWLDSLPAREMELARLVRGRDVNEKVYMMLLERREEIRISEAKQIPGSRVIDRPLLPTEPITPRKGLNLGLGAVLGLIVGFGLGFVLEGPASRLRSMLEFEHETGWSVLALVPPVRGGPVHWRWLREGSRRTRGAEATRGNVLIALRDPDSAAGESYNILRTRLELLGMGSKHRSLLVTSSGPHDGKSSTLSNLAATFGSVGRRTVVVDAELRRPTMHSIFRVERSPGLIDLLLNRNGDGDSSGEKAGPSTLYKGDRALAAEDDSVTQETSVRGVAVLASGNQTRDASGEISWEAMRAVLEDLKRKYDIVLVDSAPPVLVHDALILCGLVDAVLVVVDARSYDVQRLVETKLLLERAGANVVGAVLNRVDPRGRYAYSYRRDRA